MATAGKGRGVLPRRGQSSDCLRRDMVTVEGFGGEVPLMKISLNSIWVLGVVLMVAMEGHRSGVINTAHGGRVVNGG
ncbi:hypothetical protein Acr_05g0015900 [Actinidia rufa]|uniref:Uncharacterized protein n=1 Tax=Actinidia rufa TaxID=165716 RepID=A0A7J0EN93_9ERIC|nr:hypothetical protein Acr_05g0015900 [Actinidia rufa]